MNATTVVAIAGIVGTLLSGLGGHFLQARLKERGERRGKFNELQVALFLEAMTFAQREEAWLDYIQTDYASKREFPEVAREEIITAKMALFAPETVAVEWKNLVRARADLSWHLNENEPELALSELGVPDIAELVAVRDAIALLRTSMRQALDVPGN